MCTNYCNKFSRGGFAQILTEVESAGKMQNAGSRTSASQSSDATAMLPWETRSENHFPGDSAQIISRWSLEEATNHGLAARHGEGNAMWDSPGRGLGHRYRWCLGHRASHLSLCLGAGSRPCYLPPCRTTCNGPSSKLERKHTTQCEFRTCTPGLACRPTTAPPWLHLLPLYLGTQRTVGSRPLMLKCFPSN